MLRCGFRPRGALKHFQRPADKVEKEKGAKGKSKTPRRVRRRLLERKDKLEQWKRIGHSTRTTNRELEIVTEKLQEV